MTDTQHHPTSLCLAALSLFDGTLDTLGSTRELFTADDRATFDHAISLYLRTQYNCFVAGYFKGDHAAADRKVAEVLEAYDVEEVIHRACALDNSPLMMEVCSLAMLYAAVFNIVAWRRLAAVVDTLYRDLPQPVLA